MLFTVPNLRAIKRIITKEKCKYLRYYSNRNSYKLLFFGSDSIAFSSFKKVNEFRYLQENPLLSQTAFLLRKLICIFHLLRKAGNIIDCLDLVITDNAKNKSEIEKYAQAENITTKLWPLQCLQAKEYDLGLIVAFGHLIKDDLLDKFPL